ncbi:MAG: CidA/LrgA family protein [Phascolarctobacterium sp.]|nr:CidA/LrgA family protein [Phascolarctobacterium sp.]
MEKYIYHVKERIIMLSASLLRGFSILLILQWLSAIITDFFKIPFPSPLLGMLLLAVLLKTGIIPISAVEDICDILIDKMGMLFLPAGVSLLLYIDIVRAELSPILLTLCISSLIILAVTSLFLETVLKKKRKGGNSDVS